MIWSALRVKPNPEVALYANENPTLSEAPFPFGSRRAEACSFKGALQLLINRYG